jgi:hypothetical protein
MRIGLSAAAGALLLGAVLVVSASAGAPRQATVVHTCSATDRQFISTAQVNMAALDLWSDQYLHGGARAGEVVKEARDAATIVEQTNPSDPSLTQTKYLMNAMFTEYAAAVLAKQHHREPGQHIYRAYGFANFAHDILVQAQPDLKKRGCDVGDLL